MRKFSIAFRGFLASIALVLSANAVYALPDSIRVSTFHTIASYLENHSIDLMLERIGYSEPTRPPRELFSKLAAIRKIEFAYYSAERAKPNEGGANVLAMLRTMISSERAAILHEPSLNFLNGRGGTPPLPFALVTRKDTRTLEPHVRIAITTIAEYSAASRGNTPARLLMRSFQLSEEEAYSLLRKSLSLESAFVQAYSDAGANGPRMLQKLVRDVVMDPTLPSAGMDYSLIFFSMPMTPEELFLGVSRLNSTIERQAWSNWEKSNSENPGQHTSGSTPRSSPDIPLSRPPSDITRPIYRPPVTRPRPRP